MNPGFAVPDARTRSKHDLESQWSLASEGHRSSCQDEIQDLHGEVRSSEKDFETYSWVPSYPDLLLVKAVV